MVVILIFECLRRTHPGRETPLTHRLFRSAKRKAVLPALQVHSELRPPPSPGLGASRKDGRGLGAAIRGAPILKTKNPQRAFEVAGP